MREELDDAERLNDKANQGAKNVRDPWAQEVLRNLIDQNDLLRSAVRRLVADREAEREATPPSAGDGDEVTKPSTGERYRPCACGLLHRLDVACPSGYATPPPAPVDEAAVEAPGPNAPAGEFMDERHVRNVLRRIHACYEAGGPDRDQVIRIALWDLVSDARRGYGPTGASVGAGEVEPWALRQAIGIIEHAYNGDEMVPGCLTALRAALDTP